MTYIQVQHIQKKFQHPVLQDVSFEIKKGERFGLIGPNGAGKSTLIDIMTGLTKADQGEVLIDGLNVKSDIIAIRRKLGVVPQDLALLEELNAYDNLSYFGGMYGLSGKNLKEKVDELLEVIGLTEHAKKKVKTYSGGMKRRLNIAAALLHDPEFLILDEPTVGVDPQSRQHIFDFLKSLNDKGTTILYISHYMEEVEALCDRLFILDLGREVAYGSQDDVRQLVRQTNHVRMELDFVPTSLVQTLLDSDNGITDVTVEFNQLRLLVQLRDFSMNKLLQEIAKTDSVIKSIYIEDISLEDAFLQLTGKTLRD